MKCEIGYVIGMEHETQTQARPPKVRTLVAFSSLIMLLFCVFVAYQASKAYDTALIDSRAEATRLTEILSEQAELTFLSVDLTLRRAVERQYFNTLFGGNLPKDIENNFRMWVDETPQVAAMMMVDETGTVRVAAHKEGYGQWTSYRENQAGSVAFQTLEDDAYEGLYVGYRPSGNPKHPDLIVMSRKLNNLNGEFGGMIVVVIDPKFFLNFFDAIDFGEHRFMSLFHENGLLLFTGPHVDAQQKEINEYLIDLAQADKRKGAKVKNDTTSFGDTIKTLAYKRLPNLPVYIGVVKSEEDFLEGWRDARLKDISFLAIFTIFGSVLSFFALTMAKQIVRVEESESAAILASQAKSEFLANMSHELRTPLNAIIGFSEMMNAEYFGPLNDKQKERINDINLCGTHLLQLISDILEFSKGEAGKLEIHEEDVHIAETIEECVRIINERAKGKDIVIKVHADYELPMLYADKRKMRQILLNLLSNAVKFTPNYGTITVSARVDKIGQLHVDVKDTGVGIPEEDIPTALSVFGQVHRGQSHEGTGLGLPLCKMFAELHGGRLILTSKVGDGTNVRITFPASRLKD